jgi:hypothetical protein
MPRVAKGYIEQLPSGSFRVSVYVSSLVASTCATPPPASATVEAVPPHCGTMPTRSPRSTDEPPPTSPS